jgi:hypothetical protein
MSGSMSAASAAASVVTAAAADVSDVNRYVVDEQELYAMLLRRCNVADKEKVGLDGSKSLVTSAVLIGVVAGTNAAGSAVGKMLLQNLHKLIVSCGTDFSTLVFSAFDFVTAVGDCGQQLSILGTERFHLLVDTATAPLPPSEQQHERSKKATLHALKKARKAARPGATGEHTEELAALQAQYDLDTAAQLEDKEVELDAEISVKVRAYESAKLEHDVKVQRLKQVDLEIQMQTRFMTLVESYSQLAKLILNTLRDKLAAYPSLEESLHESVVIPHKSALTVEDPIGTDSLTGVYYLLRKNYGNVTVIHFSDALHSLLEFRGSTTNTLAAVTEINLRRAEWARYEYFRHLTVDSFFALVFAGGFARGSMPREKSMC